MKIGEAFEQDWMTAGNRFGEWVSWCNWQISRFNIGDLTKEGWSLIKFEDRILED